MSGEIDKIIKDRNLKPVDCAYHTIRNSPDTGKVRALLVKGETDMHIEYICPFCKNSGYKIQKWIDVSKAAKIKFKFDCDSCSKTINVLKLKKVDKKK